RVSPRPAVGRSRGVDAHRHCAEAGRHIPRGRSEPVSVVPSQRRTTLVNKISRSAAASTAAAIALCAARDARAAGIGLDVQSGRGTGMASAVTASVDDASGIYYNPAGIAQGKGLEVMVGDTVILPSFQFKAPDGTSTSNASELIPPFHAYVTGG